MARPDFANLFAWCDLHASRLHGALDEPLIRRLLDRPRYFDRQGFPIPGDQSDQHAATMTWAHLMSRHDYVVVCQDDLPDGGLLSTVWLGLDQAWVGPPVFFETMRFAAHELPAEDIQIGGVTHTVPAHHPSEDFPNIFADGDETTSQLRYGSEEEARAAHHAILRKIRKQEGH